MGDRVEGKDIGRQGRRRRSGKEGHSVRRSGREVWRPRKENKEDTDQLERVWEEGRKEEGVMEVGVRGGKKGDREERECVREEEEGMREKGGGGGVDTEQ